jgi:hypothetical protein
MIARDKLQTMVAQLSAKFGILDQMKQSRGKGGRVI